MPERARRVERRNALWAASEARTTRYLERSPALEIPREMRDFVQL